MNCVNCVKCKVLLYDGQWKRKLGREVVVSALRRSVFGDCTLTELTFLEPGDDVAFEIDIAVATDWSDEENVCDRIIERLLQFEPEYESMIEVEVYDAR